MDSSWSLTKIFKPQAGWYCGELHIHSSHSDGRHNPAGIVEMARAAGLDFVAITDHNRFDAFTRPSPAPDFLIIPGMELTLQNGHFNVYGLQQRRLDWMDRVCVGLPTIKLSGPYNTTTALMRRMTEQGLVTSINHPMRPPFDWQDGSTALQYVHCLEIWNRADRAACWPSNRQAVALWSRWLNAGHRATAMCGSDFHASTPLPGTPYPAEQLGRSKLYVYAESLSGAAILAALRQRRVYLSLGPEVRFQAKVGGKMYDIGADLGPVAGAIDFQAEVWASPHPARARIVKNDEVVLAQAIETDAARLSYSDQAQLSEPAWYRLEIAADAEDDRLLAITNPIFVGPRPQPALETYGDFVPGLE